MNTVALAILEIVLLRKCEIPSEKRQRLVRIVGCDGQTHTLQKDITLWSGSYFHIIVK